MSGLIQSIVQKAWQVGMKVSIGKLAKGQGLCQPGRTEFVSEMISARSQEHACYP
jgi:hypothetical protein